jgi:UDP-N-acetyl-D-galactosamine dehydrogenase
LVGGHCISVDPYYLTHKAETVGLHAEVILASRRVNDQVAERIALDCVKLSGKCGSRLRRVTILGLTYKENVPDLRNSKVFGIIEVLLDHGLHVQVHDPIAWPEDAMREHSVALTPVENLAPADAVILAVPHTQFVAGGWRFVRSLLGEAGGVVMDVKAVLSREEKPADVTLWRP